MTTVFIASDAQWVVDEVAAGLSALNVTTVGIPNGPAVRTQVAEHAPDLLICDLQVGSMGGYAIAQDLRLEESGGRLPHVPILLLLDRRADVFIAQRVDVEGWILKPLNPIRLRKAAEALLDGGKFHDDSQLPETVETN